MCTEPSHPSLANSHSSGKLLLLFSGFVFCVLFLTMDFVWMRDFLEGMLKPLAATMVVDRSGLPLHGSSFFPPHVFHSYKLCLVFEKI